MRRFKMLAGLTAALLLAGCLGGCRRDIPVNPVNPAANAVTAEKPTTAQLVAYMNENAHLLQSIKSTRLEMEAHEGRDGIGLVGTLFCAKPRDFRLRATVVGQQGVDIGSNKDEFWFYIGQAKDQDGVARVHYCSYEDMTAGKARMPFPFQPDMVVAALGMGEYDPTKEYTLRDDAKTVSLVEKTVSAQGQPVQRVTVFNKMKVTAPGKPQVIAHVLLDDKGNEICRANIEEVETIAIDRGARAVVPKRVRLSWPAQQISLGMRLYDTQVNSIDAVHAAKLFSRADLSAIPAANLAQGGAPDAPSGYSQMSIQRTQLLAPAAK